jgi:hypothetical protein
LPGSESALLAVNVDMRQVKVRCTNAGERIKHPERFVDLLHRVSPCVIGLCSL